MGEDAARGWLNAAFRPGITAAVNGRPAKDDMSAKSKAYLLGGGIGSLAAAAFMIRDGGIPGENISILEAAPVMGGSLDGAGDPAVGYSLRGGRMLTTDNYECTWDLYKSIPSLNNEGKTVFDETVEFNETHKANSMARLVDRRRAKVVGHFHGVLHAGPARVAESQQGRRRCIGRKLHYRLAFARVLRD